MRGFEGVDALFELDVVGWELGLLGGWLAGECCYRDNRCGIEGSTFSSACPSCSFTYCCVRVAKGVKVLLSQDINGRSYGGMGHAVEVG